MRKIPKACKCGCGNWHEGGRGRLYIPGHEVSGTEKATAWMARYRASQPIKARWSAFRSNCIRDGGPTPPYGFEHFEAWYLTAVKRASGRCESCNREFRAAMKEPHVDHAHDSSCKLRALLCLECNLLEGNTLEQMSQVIAYKFKQQEKVVGEIGMSCGGVIT